MTEVRLREILSKFKNVRIAVVGDFFLDRLLMIDSSLDEVSLETGLTAYQVTQKILLPGAAGTIASNLAALGVGKIYAVGAIGTDGEGFELRRELNNRGVDTHSLAYDTDIFTPTYTKPIIKNKMRELNRIDIRNRKKMPERIEEATKKSINLLMKDVDAVIMLDQVVEENLGIITESIREFISGIGENTEKIVYADSRAHLNRFKNIILKCNNFEAAHIAGCTQDQARDLEFVKNCAKQISNKTGKITFVTCGDMGIVSADSSYAKLASAVKVEGDIDICGAGDAATSGIVSALCSGATAHEAAQIGNIVSSITIRQIGVTGTATQQQVIDAFLLHENQG